MMSGFDIDITQAVPNGATVEVDPTASPPSLRIVTEDDDRASRHQTAKAAPIPVPAGVRRIG